MLNPPDSNLFVSNPGERYKPEYVGEVNEDGFIELVKVGETDLDELHQRDAFANDVNVLYERFCNGDITALSARQGSFLDALGLPRDLRGMYEMVENFGAAYDNLPDSIREKYSRDRWISEAGSEQWIRDLTAMQSAPVTDTSLSDPESAPPSA